MNLRNIIRVFARSMSLLKPLLLCSDVFCVMREGVCFVMKRISFPCSV